jgi:transposase
MIAGALLLSLSPDLWIAQITATTTDLIVHLVSTQPATHCPLCGQASEHVHSRYRRRVADVPCGSKPVSLSLEVRKFFCRNPSCPRHILTERLPELVQPWARMTNRLRSALQALGLATGGEGGAWLAPKLGMRVAPTTLLRGMRAMSTPVVETVHVLGIDDWSYKRGQTFGTILVDLERHRVIDLLPDRTAETVKSWLERHPEIEVISRDRASSYAEAARQGAPQALQVADRFHLVKNMREKVQELLARRRNYLPFVQEALPSAGREGDCQEKHASQQALQVATVQPIEETPSWQQTVRDQQRKRNRAKRYALYEEVKDLRRQGLSHYAIADRLGISRPTVRRFLAAECFPERLDSPRARHQSIVAPYLPFLRERWQAGCHNGRQLFREAKARGYPGSRAQLERVTTQWRKQLPPRPSPSPTKEPARATPSAPKRHRLSSQRASWLFILAQEKLTATQQRQVEQICQASEELSIAYELSQDFVGLFKEHKAQALKDWLSRAKGSTINELKSIAKSMQQDYAAIEAACSQSWNQGQVEGHINRLKCLKRQMYGRARFDLLRLRVLHAA